MSDKHASRRRFIRQMALGAAGVAASPHVLTAAGKTSTLYRKQGFSANDQVQIALIGAGGMGVEDAKTALRIPGVKLVAVCDLYKGRLEEARVRWGRDIMTTMDYREIIQRSDIDAVIVGTPDHWHKQISVDALMSGKGVYCEKPMVHSVEEGPAVIAAQQQSGKTFEVGSQGMSSLGNEHAKALYESGAIGQLIYAEGFWARNSPIGAWQYPIPADASQETVDWDRYISNTTKRAWDPLRFFRWRNYRDYGTGVSGDLFVHLFSSLHFIVSSNGPNKIQATGGLRYWKDGREVPDVLLGMFDYPETESHPAFNLSLRVNFVDGTSGSTYLKLVGSEGAMDVEWRKVTLRQNEAYDPMDAFAMSKQAEGAARPPKPARKKMVEDNQDIVFRAEPGYWGAHYDHLNNFITGVREGKQVAQDAVFGYRAAAPALLCNDSYFGDKIIHWDPEAMKVL
ncbi:MAG: Gfo/Idh/MocA family oxidoreductase [Saprospiraceae bacterium]|nr:Gfo/Idh/MocA family oxidoreductase [Saprospiraceae bacterium]